MDKKEILYNFTQDNQANIRFIESKTTIITAIIGAIVIYYLQKIGNFITNLEDLSCINLILLFTVTVVIIISCFYLFMVIMPISNPKLKLPNQYHSYPNLYLSSEKLNKDTSDLSEYQIVFENENNMEQSIELEYLKTSLIRNEKLLNFKKLTISIIILVILFVVHIVVFHNEFLHIKP